MSPNSIQTYTNSSTSSTSTNAYYTTTTTNNNNNNNNNNYHLYNSSHNMAWALYLSNTSASSVTDAQLAELDDYELVSRTGPIATADHLSRRIGHIVYALVCAAGAVNSRTHMLRSVTLLDSLLRHADATLLCTAVEGLVQLSSSSSSSFQYEHQQDPPFLRPLVNIAVNRVSDVQLSTKAAHSLAILLGHPSLDRNLPYHHHHHHSKSQPTHNIPPHLQIQIQTQTKRLIALLITQIVLTASPEALASLARLLRRDDARKAFYDKDGVSTLASTLQTTPGVPHTAIGAEIVADAKNLTNNHSHNDHNKHNININRIKDNQNRTSANSFNSYSMNMNNTTIPTNTIRHSTDTSSDDNCNSPSNPHLGPVYASYHAVFAVWMLSFASRPHVVRDILQHVVNTRLVLTLARLLSHASGQRLKIARVTLASLRNLALGPSSSSQPPITAVATFPTERLTSDSSNTTNSVTTATTATTETSMSTKTIQNEICLLRQRIRRDLLVAQVPSVLRRLMRVASVQGSLMGNDDDAVDDAHVLSQSLSEESDRMSTLDVYIAHVTTRTLTASPVHRDESFWSRHAHDLVSKHRQALTSLINIICIDDVNDEQRVAACHDLIHIMRFAPQIARPLLRNNHKLKGTLMQFVANSNTMPKLKAVALLCIQTMLVNQSLRRVI